MCTLLCLPSLLWPWEVILEAEMNSLIWHTAAWAENMDEWCIGGPRLSDSFPLCSVRCLPHPAARKPVHSLPMCLHLFNLFVPSNNCMNSNLSIRTMSCTPWYRKYEYHVNTPLVFLEWVNKCCTLVSHISFLGHYEQYMHNRFRFSVPGALTGQKEIYLKNWNWVHFKECF